MSEYKKVAAAADRIREAMTDAGKKQADLVRETGLDRAAISSYLSGKYEPKQKALGLLAIALGVNEMWLYGYDIPRDRTPEQKRNDELVKIITLMRRDEELLDMAEKFSRLTPEQRASIKQLLAVMAPE